MWTNANDPAPASPSAPAFTSASAGSSADVASHLRSPLAGVAPFPTASPTETSANQPPTTQERMSHGEGNSDRDHTPDDAAPLPSASQSNDHVEGSELHANFRGLSLTPAPSLPAVPQGPARKETKRKRRESAIPPAGFAPVDDKCDNCKPSDRRLSRECISTGPNRACLACSTRRMACSKGEYEHELLSWDPFI
jgi:hypothetical protein